jgi:hypothetical protein
MSRDAGTTFAAARCGKSWSVLCVLVSGSACGVIEYPHAEPVVDASNDFAPSTPMTATAPAAAIAANSGAAAPSPSQPKAGTAAAPTRVSGGGGMGAPAANGGTTAAPGTTATPGQVTPTPTPTPTPTSMPTTTTAGAASTQPAAVTLDLGGTAVAKEDVIAFIHFGHSNMAGRATGPSQDRPYFFTQTDPHTWMYHVGKPPELAKEPYTACDDLSGTYGGPGTALLKQAVQMAPNKYFLSLGFGKTSAYCSQFLPGSLYYDSLSKAAIAIKDRVTFGAIVIMLGITERHGSADDISGYADCINKLVTAVRTDVGRPDLPLLITDYEQEAIGSLAVSSAFAQKIIPEIHKIPSLVKNSVVVPTDGLTMQDDHHFDFEGHKVWTQRVLDLMKMNGWFPWAQ